jgi:hypothetical protein
MQTLGEVGLILDQVDPGEWVAGSFRSDSAQKAQEVGLSCAVPPDQVLRVWITDPQGRVVLDGSVT